ncbi:MAG TPA: hypothetical protein VH986_12750, partial [Acidimicrobiia bacterium]
MRSARTLAAVVVALTVASAGGWWLGAARRAAAAPYRVVEVLDGDTVVVDGHGRERDTIRLLG